MFYKKKGLPEENELIICTVKKILFHSIFVTLDEYENLEGMIHISQSMDDFVSFSKDKVLSGKESKRSLKVGDLCKARLIAVSYKDLSNPKLGLTMRQKHLGKLEWLKEEKK